MTLRTTIEAKLVFEATHRWPGALAYDEVGYLAHPHRHRFVIRAAVAVDHPDRQVEFIMLGHEIGAYLGGRYPDGNLGTTSCERLAADLVEAFDLDRCSVHEDDENGAIVERSR